MIAILILGFLFLAAAIRLVLWALTLPRVRMSAQVRQIRAYGFDADAIAPVTNERPSLGIPLERLASSIGRSVQASVPALKPLARGQLVAGGVRRLSVDAFHGYRVMLGIGLPGLIILNGVGSGTFSAISVLLVPMSMLVGWQLPASVVRRRAQAHLDAIDRGLPELVDVLTATIESGLGFGGSLQLVADRFDGPLGDELRLTLHEQSMGLATQHSLANLLDRCETPSMRAFVRALQQGDSLGVSIGQMMRSLSADTRKRRRQAAHEQVLKAPLKLLFPLIFLIFPALMLVLLYPAVSSLLSQLSHG